MDTRSREMKYIIAGGRDFGDNKQMNAAMGRILGRREEKPTVISGCARGADDMGAGIARANGMEVLKFPADWDKHGKSAGVIRNQQMAQEADGLIAFWDGKSKGTKHMIEAATRCGLEVHIYRY